MVTVFVNVLHERLNTYFLNNLKKEQQKNKPKISKPEKENRFDPEHSTTLGRSDTQVLADPCLSSATSSLS